MLAESLIQNTWFKKDMYQFGHLISVNSIKNSSLESSFTNYTDSLSVGGVPNAHEIFVFHGCTEAAMDLDNPNSIIRTGFLKKYWKSSAGDWQRFGPGF